MRILFSSHVFAPSVGGLETVSRNLAEEFVRQGHEVQLVTHTLPAQPPAPEPAPPAFPIWRRPSVQRLVQLLGWCDVCFHNNISLPRAWPLLLVRRPWIVAHHVWIPRAGLAARLKRFALRYAAGISISEAIAVHLATPSRVIPNPYDDATFRVLPTVARNRDLIFVGRLVSDKGVELLLRALAGLVANGLRPNLSIIGAGPEEQALRDQSTALGLQAQVRFLGELRGTDLARALNGHRVIVVPSIWQEPFGIVALEAIACGCVAIGSAGGGLRDAIGPCGLTFPNGDVAALTAALAQVLCEPQCLQALRRGAEQHLRRHQLESVAREYLAVFSQQMNAGRGRSIRGLTDVG